MKVFNARPILATILASCLGGQPVAAAMAPTATGMEGTTSETVTATEVTPQRTTQVMGGLNLSKTPMTMDFQDADVRDVLHLLAVKSGMNIIYGADVTGPVSVHLDRVPFDQAFQTVLTLKGLVALPMGHRVIRVVTSTALTTEQSQATTFTRVFRLNYALADEIKRPIDAIRGSAGRKGVSTVDTKTNSLVITDTVEGLKEVEDLIPILDKKPQQVDIEAKVVEVSLDDQTQAGISWQYAVQNGAGNVQIGATDVGGTGSYGAVQGSGNSPLPTGTVNANTGINVGTGINLAGGSLDKIGLSFLTSKGSYLLAAQLTALSTKGRVKILSTPHIVTTNNEEAKIEVADQIPYGVTTLSGSGLATQSIQFISAGVRLTVKPTINADRRITMKVKPEVSNAVGSALPGFPPTVNSRNADTTVILKDGDTLAIGGLIKEQIDKTTTGIPLLMSIPILGRLFKSTDDRKRRTELIVFMTPRIAAE